VVLGDFNTHHPWWDPLASNTQNADELVNWLETADLTLLNTPGTGTFFRPNLPRESVLDLTFATSALASRIQDWQTLPDLGSDHYGVLFTILGTSANLVDNPLHLEHFNTRLANWDLFASSLRNHTTNSSILNS
jgi:Endonuclease-reverse transcriptase